MLFAVWALKRTIRGTLVLANLSLESGRLLLRNFPQTTEQQPG